MKLDFGIKESEYEEERVIGRKRGVTPGNLRRNPKENTRKTEAQRREELIKQKIISKY